MNLICIRRSVFWQNLNEKINGWNEIYLVAPILDWSGFMINSTKQIHSLVKLCLIVGTLSNLRVIMCVITLFCYKRRSLRFLWCHWNRVKSPSTKPRQNTAQRESYIFFLVHGTCIYLFMHTNQLHEKLYEKDKDITVPTSAMQINKFYLWLLVGEYAISSTEMSCCQNDNLM